MDLKLEHRIPTVSEYQELRNTTGWEHLADRIVDKSLGNSLFSVCVIKNSKIIGTGRVIGDGGMYFYIQDVIVIPEFQGEGIGKLIMLEIEKYLSENASENSFIGLMSAEGVKKFYSKFDYKQRPNDRPGMYKLIKPNQQ